MTRVWVAYHTFMATGMTAGPRIRQVFEVPRGVEFNVGDIVGVDNNGELRNVIVGGLMPIGYVDQVSNKLQIPKDFRAEYKAAVAEHAAEAGVRLRRKGRKR